MPVRLLTGGSRGSPPVVALAASRRQPTAAAAAQPVQGVERGERAHGEGAQAAVGRVGARHTVEPGVGLARQVGQEVRAQTARDVDAQGVAERAQRGRSSLNNKISLSLIISSKNTPRSNHLNNIFVSC